MSEFDLDAKVAVWSESTLETLKAHEPVSAEFERGWEQCADVIRHHLREEN